MKKFILYTKGIKNTVIFRVPLIDKIEELQTEWNLEYLEAQDVDGKLSSIGIQWKLYHTKSLSGFKSSKKFGGL